MSASNAIGRVQLGNSDLEVSPIGFGCWPIAGVSSLHVTDAHSLATLQAAIDSGVNFFDTAYAYGYDGEADRLLAQAIRGRREEVVIATKVGQYFDDQRKRVVDGRRTTLLKHAEASLKRLGTDFVDIMYLHFPDPTLSIKESAAAIAEIVNRGWARYAGVSNVDPQQLSDFQQECPVVVVQPPFNMLQPDSVAEIRPKCEELGVSIVCYWVLMKGLLAGKLPRDHQFDPNDKRLTYPIFQGEAWNRSQDFLDHLRQMASDLKCTVSQLVIAWTLRQPGITVALCGAKRAEQITETAAAMHIKLDDSCLSQIDEWLRAFAQP